MHFVNFVPGLLAPFSDADVVLRYHFVDREEDEHPCEHRRKKDAEQTGGKHAVVTEVLVNVPPPSSRMHAPMPSWNRRIMDILAGMLHRAGALER